MENDETIWIGFKYPDSLIRRYTIRDTFLLGDEASFKPPYLNPMSRGKYHTKTWVCFSTFPVTAGCKLFDINKDFGIRPEEIINNFIDDSHYYNYTVYAMGNEMFLLNTPNGSYYIHNSNPCNKYSDNLVPYPNPAQQNITLKGVDFPDRFSVVLYNSNAQLIQQRSFENVRGECSLDVSGLEAGLYLGILQLPERNLTFRFVKE
jgi:hypothetical protein